MAWITHPRAGGPVEVPDSSVKVWAAAGWQETEPPVPPAPPEPEPASSRRRKSQPAAAGTDSEE